MQPLERSVKFSISRRDLLRLLLPMAAWLPAPLMLLAAPDSRASAQPAALGPFLDTLLPGDAGPAATSAAIPAATELGVDRQLLEQAQSDPQLARLIAAGCAWLDQQAQGLGHADYAALDESRRILVVSRAERSRDRSLPKVFFAVLLDLAYPHYYGNSVTWPALGYAGPPQPAGFRDFTQPPEGAE